MENKIKLTMSYTESIDGGFVGVINEFPGVMSQGETVEELSFNLKDALGAMLESNRDHALIENSVQQEILEIAC